MTEVKNVFLLDIVKNIKHIDFIIPSPRDVVFKEEEAWDGSIGKLVGEEAVTPHAEDEEDE